MNEEGIESLHNLDLNRFYKVYITLHEMLADRKFEPEEPFLSKSEWISQYLGFLADLEDSNNEINVFDIIDNMSLVFKNKNKKMLVYFHPLDSKLCQDDIIYVHTTMKKKTCKHLIIVANNKATPKVSTVLGILGNNTQLFSEDELLYNVTKHQLVPKHRRVNKEEREIILNSYAKCPNGDIRTDLLPAMFSCDIVARWYNYKIDDIIEIKRLRPDGFYDLSYRIITPPITEKDKK